jgi:allantoinase
MPWDLLLRGGTVVTPTGPLTADLAVADGLVAEISPDLVGGAREEIDASGCHLFPGVIDTHVHFNDPGRATWEGVASGSAAVAAGGGTLFADMPLNASPPTLDGPAFDAKLAVCKAKARTDFALWGGIVPGRVDRLPELAERGVIGFKAFMSDSGIDDFPAADEATLAAGMRVAVAVGLPVAVHAEDDDITRRLARGAIASGRLTARDYLDSRPVRAETAAITRAIDLAAETGASLHVVHVSSGAGLALVAAARGRGLDVTCETCPHYLVLTAADCERLGAVAKCAPPLRDAPDLTALWEGVVDGRIQLLASDHSPAPAAMKQSRNFFEIWGGISGCQTLLGLLLEAGYSQRRVPLARIADLVASAPAARYKLPGRGRLEPGWQADFAVVDLQVAEPLKVGALRDRHRLSPYLGRILRGAIQRTVLRGRTIAIKGEPVGPPAGRLARPAR